MSSFGVDEVTWRRRLLHVVRRLAAAAPVQQQEWVANAVWELEEQADSEARQRRVTERRERFKLIMLAWFTVLLFGCVICLFFLW